MDTYVKSCGKLYVDTYTVTVICAHQTNAQFSINSFDISDNSITLGAELGSVCTSEYTWFYFISC